MDRPRRRRRRRPDIRIRPAAAEQIKQEFITRIERLAAENTLFYNITNRMSAAPDIAENIKRTREKYLGKLKKGKLFMALLDGGSRSLKFIEEGGAKNFWLMTTCVVEKKSGCKMFVAFDELGRKTVIFKAGGEEPHFSKVIGIKGSWHSNPELVSTTPSEKDPHTAKIIEEIKKTEGKFAEAEARSLVDFAIIFKLL